MENNTIPCHQGEPMGSAQCAHYSNYPLKAVDWTMSNGRMAMVFVHGFLTGIYLALAIVLTFLEMYAPAAVCAFFVPWFVCGGAIYATHRTDARL